MSWREDGFALSSRDRSFLVKACSRSSNLAGLERVEWLFMSSSTAGERHSATVLLMTGSRDSQNAPSGLTGFQDCEDMVSGR